MKLNADIALVKLRVMCKKTAFTVEAKSLKKVVVLTTYSATNVMLAVNNSSVAND